MVAIPSDADGNASFLHIPLVDMGNAWAAVVIESGQWRSVQLPPGVQFLQFPQFPEMRSCQCIYRTKSKPISLPCSKAQRSSNLHDTIPPAERTTLPQLLNIQRS